MTACEPVVGAELAPPAPSIEYRRAAGSYPYMSGLTVAQAVAVAGGYTYRASRNRITIFRQGTGQAQTVTEDTLVTPGDVIRVPERYF